ncbi:MAG: ABC transporter permease [Clostridia bacterium]|nr:MAG: ABC transporter permease [Clostridia bacterium]
MSSCNSPERRCPEMLPTSMWQKELLEITRDRRSLALKLVYPGALTAHMLLGTTPPGVTATVITLLVAFTGVFGSGASLAQDRQQGALARLFLTPRSPRRCILEPALVRTLLGLLQVLPVLVMFAAVNEGGPVPFAFLLLLGLLSLLAANLLGVFLGGLADSGVQVHLYAVLVLFPLLALAGLFSPWPEGSFMASFSRFLPLGAMPVGLRAAAGQVSTAWPLLLAQAWVPAFILLVVTWAISPLIARAR